MNKKVTQRFLLILFLLTLFVPSTVYAQDINPWPEVFLPDGNLNPDLVDLGVTTENPDWMSIELPFGQSLDLEANYHRYQTPSGNIVVLPSASTLFLMAMSPQESGLASSYGSLGNGYGNLITFLGLIAGNNLDWSRVQADHPEYTSPDQFWGAVLNGQQDAWTYFSGWGFITTLLQMSWDDAALRSMYLLYLNGPQNCASIPGGCSGVITPPPLPQECPDPSVTIQQPVLTIQKIAPNHPLVIGQDTENRRGADIQAIVTVPPVIFTWYEPIYEELDICRLVNEGEIPNCKTGSGSSIYDGISDTEMVFKECQTHVEQLPDAVASLQAIACLDSASQDWITAKLGQSHYEAFVHQANFNLIPGIGSWMGGCDNGGTCTATGQALRVPFADPGTFNLRLVVITMGTRFRGIPITQPRQVGIDGSMQVYVTLPALVP
jgi:hypothetical protein